MECTDCKFRKQVPLKRCKHFELGGDKKRKVRIFWNCCSFWTFLNFIRFNNLCFVSGTNDSILSYRVLTFAIFYKIQLVAVLSIKCTTDAVRHVFNK